MPTEIATTESARLIFTVGAGIEWWSFNIGHVVHDVRWS